jgi:curli production assembly/transport component CsgG/holdfast attachment protein HfaB
MATRSAARILALLSATSLALAGCVSTSAGSSGNYAKAIGNAPVTANPTPYSAALYCLADYARRYNLPSPRMAVGRISDYTGTVSSDGGRQITGGASLMANSALAKAGARIVGRDGGPVRPPLKELEPAETVRLADLVGRLGPQ